MRSKRRLTAPDILSAVVQASGISLETLQGRRFGDDIGLVRAVTAHLLRTEAGLTARETGRVLRRSRQSVHNLTGRLSNPTSARDVAALIRDVRQLLKPPEPQESRLTRLPRRQAVHVLPGLVGCRTAAGLTQAELAARAGIAPETLSRLEHGRPATAESVGRLAGALMVAIRVLTGTRDFDAFVTARFKTCTACGVLKPLPDAFVPIKGCRGYYGRCRACRAAAARRRYHSNEDIRHAEIQRAARNQRRRSRAAA